MKVVQVYKDVPGLLLSLLNEIQYQKFTADEGARKLKELEFFIASKKVLKQRKNFSAPMKKVNIADTVPAAAIAMINKYDFSSVGALKVAAAHVAAKAYLMNQGLI